MNKRKTRICILFFVMLLAICTGCASQDDSVKQEQETSEKDVDIIQLESDNVRQPADDSQETVEDQDPYADLAVAKAEGYVNVRKEPDAEAEAVGKIYDRAVAQVLGVAGENNEWLQIKSGNVEGYAKAEFFYYGDTAVSSMEDYKVQYAQINADQLNVRDGKATDAKRIAYLTLNEKVRVLENCGEWIRVQYDAETEGYISAEYVSLIEDFAYGKTLQEEVQETESRNERKENSKTDSKSDKKTDVNPPKGDYTTNAELRKAIVEYAMQYLGDKYVHGGQSLAGGTDCSGFTMYVLKEFGISIGRTPQSQYTSAGRAISYSEIQPGDIICYSGNGGKSCTHVAFYIGNGKILHAANSKDGVKISSATYTNIYGVRNVID